MNRTYNSEYYQRRMQEPGYAEARRKASLESYYKAKEREFAEAVEDIWATVCRDSMEKVLPELMKRYKIIKKK